jgi:putative ABC transport system permease protein
MAAVAGTVAIGIYLSSDDARQRAAYQPVTRSGQVSVQLTDAGDNKYAQAISAALQRTLPTRSVIVIEAAGGACNLAPAATQSCEQIDVATPPENQCPLDSLDRAPTQAEQAAAERDWRCSSRGRGFAFSGSVFVGDVPMLEAVAGLDDATAASAAATLNRGGLVTFDRRLVSADGTATIERSLVSDSQDGSTPPDPTRIAVPALLLHSDTNSAESFVSPETAKALQLAPAAVGVLADTTRMPTASEEKAARRAVAQTGSTAAVYVERGFHGHSSLYALSLIAATALITLGASGIVTGLTSADSRPDHATLAAIGANPSTRRLLAMSSSAVTALLGSLLGIVAGFIPALGVLNAQRGTGLIGAASARVAIPWAQLVTVAIVLPALAALFAGLFTRSRLPMPRRAT